MLKFKVGTNVLLTGNADMDGDVYTTLPLMTPLTIFKANANGSYEIGFNETDIQMVPEKDLAYYVGSDSFPQNVENVKVGDWVMIINDMCYMRDNQSEGLVFKERPFHYLTVGGIYQLTQESSMGNWLIKDSEMHLQAVPVDMFVKVDEGEIANG